MQTRECHPVLSCKEAVELEFGLLQSDPAREWEAMSLAGQMLGRALLDDFREIGELPKRPRVLILAGKGHNAGDAFLAVIEIVRARPETAVDVLFAFSEEESNELARKAWEKLREFAGAGSVRPFSADSREGLERFYEICIDGIFGMNFRPPFREPVGELIRWCNEEMDAALRAAIDLPSGIGDRSAEIAFRADFTYMTGSAKSPLFRPENARWAGRLRYLDLGFFDGNCASETDRKVLTPDSLRPLRALRNPLAHKRGHGHLLLIGGSRQTPGAILMSAMAAARSGVGLLTVAAPESMVPAFAAALPEAMWIGCPETESGGLALGSLSAVSRALEKSTALVVGPGIGTENETQAFLDELAREIEVPLVIDAEALQPGFLERLLQRETLRGKVAITPHTGEYERISGNGFSDSGENGLLEYARKTGFLVLLKGPPFTRICDGERIFYALEGGPVLARGGSGDLLAGIAGSLAARMPLDFALRRAVVWHGIAGEKLAREFGQEAVRTTQLLDFLASVIREEEP